MSNFNYKKYLQNNPLLSEGEQKVVVRHYDREKEELVVAYRGTDFDKAVEVKNELLKRFPEDDVMFNYDYRGEDDDKGVDIDSMAFNVSKGLFEGKQLFHYTIPKNELGVDKMVIKAKNREQLYALNSLLDPSLPLITISGLAGSGKTFITLMAAYAMVQAGYYDRIVLTRNVQPVGRDIGFLPGSMEEKMNPWIAPIMDNLRVGLKDNNLSLFNTLRSQGVIEIAPLSYIRGRTFNDSILIMDEAQNATIHELKTVITRMGENSKIILLGDVDQIDTPYIDALSNGLTIVAEKFKKKFIYHTYNFFICYP